MSFSLGANAPTKDELKAKIAEANAQSGGFMPDTAGDIVNSAIDALPAPADGTITATVSGHFDDDPAKPSSLSLAISSAPTPAPPAPPTP